MESKPSLLLSDRCRRQSRSVERELIVAVRLDGATRIGNPSPIADQSDVGEHGRAAGDGLNAGILAILDIEFVKGRGADTMHACYCAINRDVAETHGLSQVCRVRDVDNNPSSPRRKDRGEGTAAVNRD